MKLIAAIGMFVTVTIAALLSIPLLFANGGQATAAYGCGQIAIILDTIRTLESGGDYTAKAASGSASGAYQYIDTTWRTWATRVGIDTTAYPSAWTAPPDQQDRVATANVNAILAAHDAQVELIPIVWYYPAALDNPALLDTIPAPDAGNTLTIRGYQNRWLDTYNVKLTSAATLTCSTTTTDDGQWAFPLDPAAVTANQLTQAHHDYPAIDIIIAEGTPLYALTAGTVTAIHDFARNWYQAGCPTTATGCRTCGVGATITTANGWRYTYCHLGSLDVSRGQEVAAGELIGVSGNTGRSGTPHLHIEIRTADNTQRCPQPLLLALHARQPVPDPATLPAAGCSF